MYRTYMCLVLICISVREDSVIGNPFNVNWLLFLCSLLLLALYFFGCVFVFLILFVCVEFKKCSIYVSQFKSLGAVDCR